MIVHQGYLAELLNPFIDHLMAMRVQYFRYSMKLVSTGSHLEHHSFLSAHCMMIYNESYTVKNAYTCIKLFCILGSFSVWGFMRRDYFSRCMHSPLLQPPETRVSDGWQMHRFSFGPFPCPP